MKEKKWYSLIDKVYRPDNLMRAWRAVKANNGAPGVDGETVEAFGQNLDERLHQLPANPARSQPQGQRW
ncbi:hypothetical protein ACP3TJ_09840 [Desulforudis sp. 1088]|uniref:hypothetical protein n=1 Tax=unclassified Candidatus Desulforudis TaxID=2635950 RepID=UPI003CE480DC